MITIKLNKLEPLIYIVIKLKKRFLFLFLILILKNIKLMIIIIKQSIVTNDLNSFVIVIIIRILLWN